MEIIRCLVQIFYKYFFTGSFEGRTRRRRWRKRFSNFVYCVIVCIINRNSQKPCCMSKKANKSYGILSFHLLMSMGLSPPSLHREFTNSMIRTTET